jgi:hypothetical protein
MFERASFEVFGVCIFIIIILGYDFFSYKIVFESIVVYFPGMKKNEKMEDNIITFTTKVCMIKMIIDKQMTQAKAAVLLHKKKM